MTEAYLGLGSNLGDRAANLWEAVRRLADAPGCEVQRLSRLYETEPVGPQDQGWFVNAVLRLGTERSPQELLDAVKQIERDMGREPAERWGPRLIDIDLLLYGQETVASDDLVVPHPELWKRRFVLAPLLDVLPPGPLAEQVRLRLVDLGDKQTIRLLPDSSTT